jgi:hypothetical protein
MQLIPTVVRLILAGARLILAVVRLIPVVVRPADQPNRLALEKQVAKNSMTQPAALTGPKRGVMHVERRYPFLAFFLLMPLVALPSCAPATDPPADDAGEEAVAEFPQLNGPYLGQDPPGMVPELFAPGIVSTAGGEWSSTFTPDGKTFLFGYLGEPHGILIMEEVDGQWTEPRLAPFSSEFRDFDLNLSPDGSMLYFTSTRPGVAGDLEDAGSDLWVVGRGEAGWGEVMNLGELVNTPGSELYPSVTDEGTLYFFGDARGGAEARGAYVARLVGGSYAEPELLGEAINTEHGMFDPFIAADESYIIFASDRPGGLGDGDLYISFRRDDGTWGEATNLGPTINSPQTDFCPSVTKDGKYLFFSSRRPYEGTYPKIALSYRNELEVEAENPGRNVDIYWVDARVIEQYRQ